VVGVWGRDGSVPYPGVRPD